MRDRYVRVNVEIEEVIEDFVTKSYRSGVRQDVRKIRYDRLAPVQTGLQPAVAGADFIGPEVFLTQPELTLRSLRAKITWAKPSISRRIV